MRVNPGEFGPAIEAASTAGKTALSSAEQAALKLLDITRDHLTPNSLAAILKPVSEQSASEALQMLGKMGLDLRLSTDNLSFFRTGSGDSSMIHIVPQSGRSLATSIQGAEDLMGVSLRLKGFETLGESGANFMAVGNPLKRGEWSNNQAVAHMRDSFGILPGSDLPSLPVPFFMANKQGIIGAKVDGNGYLTIRQRLPFEGDFSRPDFTANSLHFNVGLGKLISPQDRLFAPGWTPLSSRASANTRISDRVFEPIKK